MQQTEGLEQWTGETRGSIIQIVLLVGSGAFTGQKDFQNL